MGGRTGCSPRGASCSDRRLAFLLGPTASPDGQLGKAGHFETSELRRRTPRNAMDRRATPKFDYDSLGSAAFWRNPHTSPNIFCAKLPFRTPISGKRATAAPPGRKGESRSTSGSQDMRTNQGTRHIGEFHPNRAIHYAPDNHLPDAQMVRAVEFRNYRTDK